MEQKIEEVLEVVKKGNEQMSNVVNSVESLAIGVTAIAKDLSTKNDKPTSEVIKHTVTFLAAVIPIGTIILNINNSILLAKEDIRHLQKDYEIVVKERKQDKIKLDNLIIKYESKVDKLKQQYTALEQSISTQNQMTRTSLANLRKDNSGLNKKIKRCCK